MQITGNLIRSVMPNCSEPDSWADAMNKVLPKYEINTELRVAMFLAQCAHESAELNVLSENLNYSEHALNRVFGKYFRKRNAANYAYKPEKIANVVYANRMENGNTRSGDGWKFRGRGIIQLTGKYNYRKFAEEFYELTGKVMTFDEVIDFLETKEGAVEAAAWYFYSRNINRQADEQDIRSATKLINGGYNGLDDRQKYYDRAIDAVFTNGGGTAETNEVSLGEVYYGIGDRHNDIRHVQDALGIMSDGIFGPGTHRAVKRFQRANRLVADGIVGPNTLKAMGIY